MSIEDAPGSEMKHCPFCGERIKAVAVKCRYCNEYLDEVDEADQGPQRPSMAERMLIPVGRPVTSIVAGYCALFGVVPFCGLPFAIAAIVCGVLALKAIKKNPELSGVGRAWFGIILGSLMAALNLLFVVVAAIGSMNQK